jgi:predicted regulator of Ras-like GTPase activity (Roadblock/LC7/MglB family)
MEEKTCLFEVRARKKKGLYLFYQGSLHDAVCGDLVGEEAAIEMAMWNRVRLSFKNPPSHKITRRINSELMTILMEAARRKDEKHQEKNLSIFDESIQENLISFNTDNDLLPPQETRNVVEPDWVIPECPGPTVLLSPESDGVLESLFSENDHFSTGNQPVMQIVDLFKKMATEMHGVMMISLMDIDGIMIAEHNPALIPSDIFAAKFAMVIRIIEKTLMKFEGVGELKETIFQASDAWIICRNVAPTIYIGLVVIRESTLGNIRLVLGKYMDKLRQLLP